MSRFVCVWCPTKCIARTHAIGCKVSHSGINDFNLTFTNILDAIVVGINVADIAGFTNV